MDIEFRSARADEAPLITELALRSKAHWGYDPHFMHAIRDELTYSPEMCASGTLVVAERAGRLLGFYRLVEGVPESRLESLFVDPPAIGIGVGRALLERALHAAEALGARSVTLEADPYAEPFYARFGAVRIGETPSGSVPGRVLPHMRFDLPGR
ncbi:GNAT family N-acetyltransferase [Glycomyces algeriensis]|uniref:N-acetyltransferase n=1 Tax=Glycomyces algeriensis TaxID=256037 RepID=A0A9W6G6K9_9ACTN|nr:GNAT family N-acetyltransferase [Glycomyces algeriensis]MDA1366303.1 GNAT family N-acetyltransferase [Glycomyces algeriensis]MDR7348648.1 GNAT superfamily N-acetyltransferase [Glycomyces algeriensis]GLI41350.1 N-acetyltransferase [Glycomyces algeriensis]